MINFLFLIAIIGVAFLVILPFVFLSKKPISLQPGILYELLPPGYRRYTISVPNGYTGEKSVPLIMALHYAGHGIPFYGEMILQEIVKPAFRELEAIIVSPDCPVKYWHQPESEQLIFDLLDTVQKKYNIDPNRILITGYSLGGMGVWHYAGRYPDHFTAAIVMAGTPPEDVLDIKWQIPLMVIHGREDEVHPLHKTKEIVLQLESQGAEIEFRVLEGVTHYETNYFVAALRNTTPWLLEAWERKDSRWGK